MTNDNITPEMLEAMKALEASGARITGGRLKSEYDAKKDDSPSLHAIATGTPDGQAAAQTALEQSMAVQASQQARNMADNQTPLSADSLREQVDKLLHVQFERGKAEVHEFAKLHWDNKQSWPTVNDAMMQLIATALQAERQRIADSLPEKKGHEQPTSWEAGFDDCLEVVRAVLESPGASASEER